MFSATKFVVAGAIVALFGGFLLSGVLTQPSDEPLPVGASASVSADPTNVTAEATITPTAIDHLPGVDLVTVQERRGVYRVLGDGIRELTKNLRGVTVGTDGVVWVLRGGNANTRMIRLGEPGASLSFARPPDLGRTREGTTFVGGSGRSLILEDGVWLDHELPECDHPLADLPSHVAADGECWSIGRGGDGLVRAGEAVWNPELGVPEDRTIYSIAVTEDGTLWTTVWAPFDGPEVSFDGLLRYDGEAWLHIPYEPADGAALRAGTGWRVAVDPDGMTWVGGIGPGGFRAAVWDGEGWATYGPADVGPVYEHMTTHFFRDGTVLFNDGQVFFDGTQLRASNLPRGTLAYGPDGNAWMVAIADDGLPDGLYVITPEAAAATE